MQKERGLHSTQNDGKDRTANRQNAPGIKRILVENAAIILFYAVFIAPAYLLLDTGLSYIAVTVMASAVSLAFAVVRRWETVPAVSIGNFCFFLFLSELYPVPVVFVMSAIMTIIPVISAVILGKFESDNRPFDNYKNLFKYFIFGIVMSSFIISVMFAQIHLLLKLITIDEMLKTFWEWMKVLISGDIMFSTVIISWFQDRDRIDKKDGIRLAISLILTFLSMILVFSFTHPGDIASEGIPYLFIIPLAWVAIRFKMRESLTILAAFIISVYIGIVIHNSWHFIEQFIIRAFGKTSLGYCITIMFIGMEAMKKRKIEIELLEKKNELDRYFDNAADLLCIAGTDGYFKKLNSEWEKTLGYSLNELIGTSFLDMIHPDDRDATVKAVSNLSMQNAVLNFINRYKHKDGSYRWLEWRSFPAGDLIYAVARDVTERIAIEDALEKKLFTLSQPVHDIDSIEFEGLFDVREIQKIQDLFASATGVASIITHTDGTPITKPSNFCHLCSGIIRKTDMGLKNCYKSDAVLGRMKDDGPTIQPCLSGGLWDAGASITVGGKHIANWLIGQVRDETQTEEKMIDYARKIGADEKEFIEAFREVPHMSKQQFTAVSDALYAVANLLSLQAFQNLKQGRFIADLKRTEEVLKQTMANLYRSQEVGKIGDWRLDLASNMIAASDQAMDLMGFKHGRAIKFEEMASLIIGEDRPAANEAMMKAVVEGRSYVVNIRIKRKDTGELRYLLSRGEVEKNADGQIIAIFGINQDITDTRHIENALRESEEKFRTIFTSVAEGIALHEIVYDNKGKAVNYRILGINPAYSTQTGIMNSDIVGKLATDAYGTPTAPYLMEYSKVAETGEPYRFETYFKPLDKYFSISAVSPRKGQFVTVFEDITDRRKREEELRQKNEELARFIYTVSHDLKSPLVTMKAFTGYLVEDIHKNDEAAQSKDMKYIQNAADKMAKLLDELLELSRIGRKDNPKKEIVFKTLVQSAVDLVAGRISEKNIEVVISDKQVLLYGDEPRLLQLYQNLIDNAAKFMGKQKKPRIEIGVRTGEEGIIFFVKDNGSGIDPRHSTKLFGLFEKLDMNSEGTGIGLALVKRIVEVHGGEIWFESAGVNKGTTMLFTLDKAKAL